MAQRRDSILKTLDWVTIGIYLLLIVAGWFSVCSASFTLGDTDFFSFSTRAGKQLVWILCSFGLAFVLLMLDDKLFDVYAYAAYGIMLILLVVTIFIAPDTRGSRSWLILGPVSLQPAEFSKFATSLALAKCMSAYGFTLGRVRDAMRVLAIILVTMMLIVAQRETGSALVYLSFFLMLYRKGMPGAVLFVGLSAVVFFVVGVRFEADMLPGDVPSSVGRSGVLLAVTLLSGILTGIYTGRWNRARLMMGVSLLVTAAAYAVARWLWPFDITVVQLGLCALQIVYLVFLSLMDRYKSTLLIALYVIGSVAMLYTVNYGFNNLLMPHQRERIKVAFGMVDDPTGAGYNVKQSEIAIGSGGLAGKGFLNGTQIKLKYVPEQDTDFIFCTVGEEHGFIGSAAVLLLYLFLILRLIKLAERQTTEFGQIYGYCVAGIFLFHLFVNIGMVLGLVPVIGIPLPFFSYGGSSLWGFTILLFIFLSIDARRERLF